ncbi:hypothetical protein CkaCkLH20_07324 [Colletotrichum karsti]|uniref:Uncharacterized protein n=1 Tax=Colletotrichum karsti TaxID=1095194 RepID=A0A9P6I244_9PEZI|nr:uncharacterized protein CkaCkLH20_07324 [Colletotrichum karsti]KAF9875058.1 hypothetical protein CkaCkLH20_07324 [Colletotrichum karsti]
MDSSSHPSTPSQRANNSTWDVKPISNPANAQWHLSLSPSDTVKLLNGYAPKGMEDRWMSCADGPDDKGNFVVHVYRSWTGHEQFEIKAKLSVSDGNSTSSDGGAAADITDITWEKGAAGLVSEQEAKDLASTVFKRVIGCELESAS